MFTPQQRLETLWLPANVDKNFLTKVSNNICLIASRGKLVVAFGLMTTTLNLENLTVEIVELFNSQLVSDSSSAIIYTPKVATHMKCQIDDSAKIHQPRIKRFGCKSPKDVS